jgi:5-hydroxyisourate hydrolase
VPQRRLRYIWPDFCRTIFMARLSTHILDTHSGTPAAGVKIELFSLSGGTERLIKTEITNSDGRTDAPLLTGDAYKPGVYELRFHMGAYFRARGVAMPDPSFVDVAPIRFGMADADGHYHVPLLASPWSYSTYRGS